MSEAVKSTEATEFTLALNKLEDLINQGCLAFLVGAGCSNCAGLPLTADLTKKVVEDVGHSTNTKTLLYEIKESFNTAKKANIENYLGELVDYLAILERRIDCGIIDPKIKIGQTEYSSEDLKKAIEEIKNTIAREIEIKVNIGLHRKFVRAVHRPMRPGKSLINSCVDYFVLNYDTLIEDALALEKISFADGISGGISGWWNPVTFEDKGLRARVIKLHGSINWTEIKDDPLPRRIPKIVEDSDISSSANHIVIWPASTKYKETQKDPYAQLLNIARATLRPKEGSQRVLIICGYSFGDTHINVEIERALHESDGRLTVVVFFADDEPTGCLKEWNIDAKIKNQLLIFCKKGFWHGEENIKAQSELDWWKFESIIRLFSGENEKVI